MIMRSSAIARRRPSSGATCPSTGFAGHVSIFPLVSPISLAQRTTGHGRSSPADPGAKMTRNYRGHSLILETTIETTDGVAVVIDFMSTRMPSSHLIRRVRGVKGSVTFRTELIMRFGYGSVVPWVRRCDDGSLQAVAGPCRLALRAPLSLRPRGRTHVRKFTVTGGEATVHTLSYGVSYLDVPRAIDPDQALEKTERSWSTCCRIPSRSPMPSPFES
jgi:hypothetical protein